jgi:hypothetical protein
MFGDIKTRRIFASQLTERVGCKTNVKTKSGG